MMNLRVLNVANNFLSGPLPDGLFSLRSLQNIDISNNSFTGTFQSIQSDPQVMTWDDVTDNSRY